MTKQQIASDFISLHKDNDLDNWLIGMTDTDENKLISVYDHLINGFFGTLRETEKNFFKIEISKFESNSGHSVIFNFELVK